ncbi:hypothetical protein CBL_02861, partial [Carabus blaptoides fortunei]
MGICDRVGALPDDVDNWMEYCTLKCKIRFKENVCPHIFHCKRPASAADLGENCTKRQRTILNTNSSAAFTEHESKASNSPSTSIFEKKTFIESQTHVTMNKGIQVKPKYRSEYTQYVCGVQDMSTSPIKSILINTITSPIKIKSSSTTVKKTLSFSSDLSSITGTSSPAVATTDLSDSLSDENSEVDKEQLTMLSVRRSLL